MNRPSSISVIICSRGHDISAEQRRNIESTIGVPHEIIAIDNSDNRYNIFSAYNEGVRQSKNDVLCFMHDDVRCKTENWGMEVLSAFEDSKVGLLGISGPSYLSTLPVPWWSIYSPQFDFPTIYQTIIDSDREGLKRSTFSQIPEKALTSTSVEVAVCDGVFLCIPKFLFSSIRFDEGNYYGFHFYDLDISMQVRNTGHKCVVSRNILLEHISSPSGLSHEWIQASNIFYKKWRRQLPISTLDYSFTQKISMQELSARKMNAILRLHDYDPFTFYTKAQLMRISFARLIRVLLRKNI